MPKKTQAIKITDLKADKPWLKKMGVQKYALETINPKKTFLIVCEGQTEELYFKSFPVANADIKPIHLGCSKTTLVECTLSMDINEYDEVWCVFDYDEKKDINGQIEDFNGAIQKALDASTDDLKIHCAYSNDSFELWFVLHYLYTDQQHHRKFYFEKLSKLWNINYEEDGKKRAFALKIYDLILNDKKADQKNARDNAEKLYESMKHLTYHKQNPTTTVYQLVDELNKYLKQ